MRRTRAFAAFLYDFVVGDDPTLAATVVAALAVTAALADVVSAWWVMPAAVALALGVSVSRGGRLPPG
jgi:hypothetical protein